MVNDAKRELPDTQYIDAESVAALTGFIAKFFGSVLNRKDCTKQESARAAVEGMIIVAATMLEGVAVTHRVDKQRATELVNQTLEQFEDEVRSAIQATP